MQKTERYARMRGNREGIHNRTAGITHRESEERAGQDGIQPRHNTDKISPKEILRHELIGLEVEVADSKNKNLVGIKGKITDETRNTLEVDNTKKLAKDQVTIKVKKGNQTFVIDGNQIVGRPEDRVKKIRKI